MRVRGVMGWVLELGAVCWLRMSWVLVGLALVPGSAWATANPAKVGTTIGRLVDSKAVALGFGAADPRVAATRSAISAEAHALLEDVVGQTELSSITSATEAAIAGTAAATSWAGTALFAGVGALLGGLPQPLSDGSADQWTINSDGTVTISGNPHVAGGSVTSPFGSLSNGATAYWSECRTLGPGCVVGGSMAAAAQAMAQAMSNSSYSYAVDSCESPEVDGGSCVMHSYRASGADNGTSNMAFYRYATVGGSSPYSGDSCATGMAWWPGSTQGGCMAYAPYSPPVQTQSSVFLDKAIASLPASDQALPVASPWMADLTDALWQQAAAQPGYQGLPYPADSPVSGADVGSIQSADPSSYPTVGDLVAPGADGSSTSSGTGSTSSPYAVSDPSASSTPAATNPGSGAQVNLGADPGIGSPTLESTPTAAQILAPLLNLLPDFRSYAMPAHSGTCPEPSFTWAGTTYTWTKHCELIEANRSLIYGAFVVAFSLAAALIVLTA